MRRSWKSWIGEKAISVVVVLAVAPILLFILDGVGTLLTEAGHWLKVGSWETADMWSGLRRWIGPERPSFGWVVPDRVLQFYLNGPRWFWMPVTGIVIFLAELLTIAGLGAAADSIARRWADRHERPIIKLTKRQKIAFACTAVWIVSVPTLLAVLIVNQSPTDQFWEVWGDMAAVGLVTAFWGWAIIGWTTGTKKAGAGGKAV